MTTESPTHPAKDQLIAFGQGKLTADESLQVESHLEACRECCETLLDLKDDTFVELVRIARPDDAGADVSRIRTELATDMKRADHESAHSATLLVQSGETVVSIDELPVELQNHPRYRIVELIGRGGMGNVYRAEHRLMNRVVAIKLINSQLVQHSQAVERFRREVQAAAKLSHPNIVAAYDAEQAGNAHFLVMEFVEGTDLASVVKHRGPMAVAEACECLQQAAAGLQHAHEKGMVHRDIKPHNLMLASVGQVRILDFGLAGFASEASAGWVEERDLPAETSATDGSWSSPHFPATAAHLTTMGTVMGTPDYMAPEQAVDAHSADIRADIYSLGCTLFYLLTGRPPFEADNVVVKLKAHASVSPPSLTEERSDVPPELSDIVARMMAKKPENRFQTPNEVVAVLEPFVRPPVKEPKRRSRTLVAALLMLFAGVIFVTTDKGRIEIQSEVDDVKVAIRRGGKEIEVVDAQTGSCVTWFPSGEYQVALKGNRNDVVIEDNIVTVTRWGREIVTIKPRANVVAAPRSKPLPPLAVAPFDATQATRHQDAWAEHLGVSVEHTNSIGMKLRLIPVGEFALHPQLKRAPQPYPNVIVQLFYAGVHEVTIGQFREFVKATSFKTSSESSGLGATRAFGMGRGLKREAQTTWQHADLAGDDQMAVGCVNWNDALAFCRWLSTKEARNYRLPTESEWIWMARAGSTDLYFFGEDVGRMAEFSWFSTNESPIDRPHAVGLKQANPWGLFDVYGNVGELCYEWLNANGTRRDTLATAPDGPGVGDRFVQRGGGYHDGPDKGTYGFFWGAAMSHIGFRVVLDTDFQAPPDLAARGQRNAAAPPVPSANEALDAAKQQEQWERLVEAQPATWTPLEPKSLSANGGMTLRRIDDASFLSEGPNPAQATYTLTLTSSLKRLTALRLDVIRDDSLPSKGPGRAENGTFVLTGIEVAHAPKAGAPSQRLTLSRAIADYSQGTHNVSGFVTGQGSWAIWRDFTIPMQNQSLVLDLAEPLALSKDSLLTITLRNQSNWAGCNLGRFKLSATDADRPALDRQQPNPPATTIPVRINLLTDPSFENTPLTQLPEGWRGWLNDGQEFRCEVVAGGHTGQHCLKISGKGTRGVVFANDIKADRTKRYALKGWAKFEGDKAARAIIKFNYFRGSEFLGVHDLVGAMDDQPGWLLFEKTDALDAYPTADHFYAMCHVEGSGSGWFDDLELIAYDRDKLPSDFDARHGRHNRLHGPNSLHRWVGTWDTEYAFRETDNSPQETKLSMTTTSERTLGDYFLVSHAKAKPPATEERLQFLLFDQNLGAFRQWVFSSNGKVFEWRGPWNQEKQTLELRMLPDASNLHSSEHFVDDDHIEAKLHFQYVMGQRDAGRWTASRKAFDGKVDVPTSKSHVAEPAELSQLNKFAGEWTIRARYKPSVWNPQPREETSHETSQWILGGRFLMTRAFNEKDELTSIWIATYEPREKSNRFWFFNADGSSGEWRLTWDEPSSGFHFRAVDLPSGWSGNGFNRWVNEDSFDNQALIKDENGRVLLDSTQDRRRRK